MVVVVLVLAALAAPGRLQRAHAATRVDVSDISYNSDGRKDTNQTFDVHYAPSSSPRPAVILIHGGGWDTGSKAFFANETVPMIQPLVDAGYVVINMDYRLAALPATKPGETATAYKDQPADAEAVIDWAKHQGGSPYFIDGNRVAVLGYSAGGQIALLTALRNSSNPQYRVKAVVSWAGPTDMVTFGLEWPCVRANGTDPCVTPSVTINKTVAGQDIGTVGVGVPEAIRKWAGGCTVQQPCRTQVYGPNSAVNHVSPDNPPILLVNAVTDQTVHFDQPAELYARELAFGNKLDTRLKPCVVPLSSALDPPDPDPSHPYSLLALTCAIHQTLPFGAMPSTLQFLAEKL